MKTFVINYRSAPMMGTIKMGSGEGVFRGKYEDADKAIDALVEELKQDKETLVKIYNLIEC